MKPRFDKIEAELKQKKSYPNYSSAKSALEHLRFISVLFKYEGIPASYINHIKDEIARFDAIKNQTKQTVDALKRVKGRMEDLVERAVINHINDKEFSTAIHTKKTDQGIEVSGYLIKTNVSLESNRKMYDIIDMNLNDIVYYDIYLYEIAYLLVRNTLEGLEKSDIKNQDLLKHNIQYLQLIRSIDENESKLNSEHTTKLEKQAIESIVAGLKNQLLVVKQVVNAQYKHKLTANKHK